MQAVFKIITTALGVLLLAAACASDESAGEPDSTSGFLFLDESGSHVCGSMMESYPPQCGEPSTKLLDLNPQSIVALMSPSDPTLAAVSWTDYVLTVTGESTDEGLSHVAIVEPTHVSGSAGLVLRVADLGIVTSEPIVLPLDLTNATDDAVSLTFSNAQRVELTLTDGSGEVYRWSDGMLFTQAIQTLEVQPGATYPYVLTAEPIELPPGEYTAKAWITANEASDVVVSWQVDLTTES